MRATPGSRFPRRRPTPSGMCGWVRIGSSDPAVALAGGASALGLPQPPHIDSPEALYTVERALLDGFRVVPLFHLPDVYGFNPRVKGGPGITPLGEWRFENLWVEAGRP